MRELSTKTTDELNLILKRLAAGDPAAREALLERSVDRLRELARRELRRFPRLRRWEETDDVMQGAAKRLMNALRDVKPPTARDFFNLSTTQIRRELIDLHRHHFGPMGSAAHHATPRPDGRSETPGDAGAALDVAAADHELHDPARLVERIEIHERLARLPHDDGEIVSLMYYQGLTREQAAAVLGVSVRTLSRRWRDTRLRLHDMLRD